MMNNMKNLIKMHYSSIAALKKTATVVFVLALIVSISNNDGSMLPFASALIIMILNYNSLAYEENSNSNFLIYSLPVKPEEYVLSKYVFGFINIVGTIIFADFLYIVLNMFNVITTQDVPMGAVNVAVIITGIIIVDVVVPIALVVGFNKARIILVFLALTPICFSSAITSVLSKVHLESISISVGNIEIFTVITGIALTILSYLITAKLYSRKDIR